MDQLKPIIQAVGAIDGSAHLVNAPTIPLVDTTDMTATLIGAEVDPDAEEELRLKSMLLDLVTDSVFMHDFEGKMLYVNETAYMSRGYTRDELLAVPLLELDTPRYASKVPLRIEQLLQSGSVMFESAHYRKDRTIMEVEVHARLVDFAGKQLVLSVTRDITSRKQAQQSAVESNIRLQSILENTPSVVFIKTLDGKYLQVNQRFNALFPTEQSKIMGKTDYDLFPKEVADQLTANDRLVIETGDPTEMEEAVPQEGGVRIYLATKFLLRTRDGDAYAICGIATDITERKQTELLNTALNSIDAAMNSTLDSSEILQRALDESANALGADGALALMLEDDHWTVRHACRMPGRAVGAGLEETEVRIASKAARNRKPVIVRSLLAMPLIVRDESVGAFLYYRSSTCDKFIPCHADFCEKLAPAVSLALENSRLYEAERNIADTLQKALLVTPDHIEGIDFGHAYHSATEAAKVGGDFYDLFELEHGRIGIVVGDVSGKGLEAATITSLVKNTIRAYSYQEEDPASVMAKTNDVLLKTSAPGIFVTAFFGVLNTVTGGLHYCAAGHPPAILKRGNKVSLMATDSPAVGLRADLAFTGHHDNLGPGEILCLYTDGITEARRGRAFYGEKKLAGLIAGLDTTTAALLPQTIIDAVMDFTGGTSADDVALLTISLAERR